MSTATKSQLLCTRCGNGFNNNNNPFLMTCTDCHQYDVDYTINLGNQIRILQINVALMNISFESKLESISNYRNNVLEKLVAQLEKEKLFLEKKSW